MLYPKLSIKSPVDQSVLSWIDSVPDKYRENITLMDCVTRFVHRINDLPDFGGINPFYKLTEILSSSEKEGQLQYWHLQTLDKYYHIGIIRYLTDGGRGALYTGHKCSNAAELRRSLSRRNNLTDGHTLVDILSNMV